MFEWAKELEALGQARLHWLHRAGFLYAMTMAAYVLVQVGPLICGIAA